MRILIMGASGMLGHKLLQELGRRHEVAGTVRESDRAVLARPSAPDRHLFKGVRAGDEVAIEGVLDAFRPSVAVNCIGIVKQLETARQALIPRLTAKTPG